MDVVEIGGGFEKRRAKQMDIYVALCKSVALAAVLPLTAGVEKSGGGLGALFPAKRVVMKSFPIYDDREVHRRRRRRLMPNARMIHAALTALSFKRESNVLKKVFIRQQLSVYPCLRSLYEFIGCEK